MAGKRRSTLSLDARLGAGLAVWAAPLTFTVVAGAEPFMPALIAISAFGIWLTAHPLLRPAPLPKPESAADLITPKVSPSPIVDAFLRKAQLIPGGKINQSNIGQWIDVAGPLGVVTPINDSADVTFALSANLSFKTANMHFRGEDWKRRLSLLQRRDPIQVRGQLVRIEGSDFYLDHCELRNPIAMTDTFQTNP